MSEEEKSSFMNGQRKVFTREEAEKFSQPMYEKVKEKFANASEVALDSLTEEEAMYYKYWGADYKVNGGLNKDQKFLAPYAAKGRGLDIGCGHIKVHENALGYDIFPFKSVDILGDSRDLSQFKDNELDFIMGAHILEHMPDVKVVLKEWKRAIRRGGIIGVVVPDGEEHPVWIASSGHKINLGPRTLTILFRKVLRMRLLKCGVVPYHKGGRVQSAYAIAQKV